MGGKDRSKKSGQKNLEGKNPRDNERLGVKRPKRERHSGDRTKIYKTKD